RHPTCTARSLINFQLERNFDFVSVYNVFGDEMGTVIDRWSGTELPASVQSTSNALRIYMKTDGSVAHKGFAVKYQTRNTKCRINSDRPDSYIESYGYALGYPEKLNLTWHISQTEGCTIRIDFRKFKLGGFGNFLGVYHGQRHASRSLTIWAGNTLPPSVESTSNKLVVEWINDGLDRRNEFSAHYSSGEFNS
ncbi:hypothetical protein T265_15520, partial [Opisthorchis viverrini]